MRRIDGRVARGSKKPTNPATGPLSVHPDNLRYPTEDTNMSDGSRSVVYLTGPSAWNNLVDMGRMDPPDPFDYDA